MLRRITRHYKLMWNAIFGNQTKAKKTRFHLGPVLLFKSLLSGWLKNENEKKSLFFFLTRRVGWQNECGLGLCYMLFWFRRFLFCFYLFASLVPTHLCTNIVSLETRIDTDLVHNCSNTGANNVLGNIPPRETEFRNVSIIASDEQQKRKRNQSLSRARFLFLSTAIPLRLVFCTNLSTRIYYFLFLLGK